MLRLCDSRLTFVTQQSSPVDVAHTLPGLDAASVHTSGESHTLITQRALPPVMTPEREQLISIKQSLLAHPISITGSNEGFYDTNIDLFLLLLH